MHEFEKILRTRVPNHLSIMLMRSVFYGLKRSHRDLRCYTKTSFCTQLNIGSNITNYDHGLNEKLLRVAIIGSPNAGKSTLINAVMDRKVCAASCKIHTTRSKTKAIFTEGAAQIVFMDTPGLVHYKEVNKYKLEKSFLRDTKSTLLEADIIGVVHDVSNAYTREFLDSKIINLLDHHNTIPSLLVLNKIDLIKSKRKLLDITRIITKGCLKGIAMPNIKTQDYKDVRGWPNFSEIFMISAMTLNGLDDLRSYLVSQATTRKWMFSSDKWSDQTPENIIINTVKAQLLNYLQQEIPYLCKPEMEFFECNDTGNIKCVVLVNCPTDRIARLIAGTSNGRLRQITENVQRDLQSAFQNHVMVSIVLKGPKETHSM